MSDEKKCWFCNAVATDTIEFNEIEFDDNEYPVCRRHKELYTRPR